MNRKAILCVGVIFCANRDLYLRPVGVLCPPAVALAKAGHSGRRRTVVILNPRVFCGVKPKERRGADLLLPLPLLFSVDSVPLCSLC